MDAMKANPHHSTEKNEYSNIGEGIRLLYPLKGSGCWIYE